MLYILLLPAIAFTLLALPVLATDKDKDIASLLALPLTDLLKITVASKTEETLSEATSVVTVFTRQQILNMGVTSVDQLLNFVPGFQVTQDNDQGRLVAVTARGRSSQFSESILFLINGQRLNDHLFGGAPLNNRLIPVENIQQVEIIRGPGSALYGSNAFLGVVNIKTVDDVKDFAVQAGDNGQRMGWVNYAQEVPEQDLAVSVFARIYKQEGADYSGYPDAYGNAEHTRDPFTNLYFLTTINWQDWTLNVAHSDHNQRDFYTFGAIANNQNDETTRQTWANLKLNQVFNDKFEADFSVGWLESAYVNYALLAPAAFLPDVALGQDLLGAPLAEQESISFSIDSRYKISEDNQLIAGFFYENAKNTDIASIFTHDPITLEYMGGGYVEFRGDKTYNGLHSRNIYGLYVQDKHAFNKHLSLTTGLRFDSYSDFGQSVNPRIALVYQTDFDAVFKAFYGRAFRAPNFTELYDKANPVEFGNANLDAETVDTFEFVYMQKFGWAQTTLTFFDYKIKNVIRIGDEIIDHPDNPLGSPQFTNSGEAKGQGLEFEIKTEPLESLTVMANWTHFLNDDDITGYPNTGSLMLNYQHQRFNLNYNIIYRDKLAVLPEQSAYSLSNLALYYDLNKNLQLKASIHNLFDKTYLTPAPNTLPTGVPNAGRSFLLGLHGSF